MAAFLSLGLTGCGSDGAQAGGVTVQDSTGIRIIENAGPLWSEGEGWTIDPTPAIEIGADGGEGTYYLYGVVAVRRLEDGRLVVANRGTSQLLLFDSLGTFTRAAGGRGEGPGELSGIRGLFRCAGDTLVVDGGTRLSFFDAEGALPPHRTDSPGAGGDHLYLGMSDASEVRVFGRHGGLRQVIRWADELDPVTGVDRALFAEKREALLRTAPNEARVRPTLDAFPALPANKPAYSRLLVDDEGYLWVREYPESAAGQPGVHDSEPHEDPVAWRVFDPARTAARHGMGPGRTATRRPGRVCPRGLARRGRCRERAAVPRDQDRGSLICT